MSRAGDLAPLPSRASARFGRRAWRLALSAADSDRLRALLAARARAEHAPPPAEASRLQPFPPFPPRPPLPATVPRRRPLRRILAAALALLALAALLLAAAHFVWGIPLPVFPTAPGAPF
jgi:ferric-dicitrate binding protein FerR (iron transport regulator)